MGSKSFEGILGRHFENRLHANPIYATIFGGLKDGEGKLGSLGLAFQQGRQKERVSTLARLEKVSPAELSDDQQIDRLALRSLLLKENEDFIRGRHGLDPAAPGLLMEILLHELMRADDEPARAATNLRSLLDRTPEFLEEALTAVAAPEPAWVKILDETVEGAPALFSAIRALLTSTQPQARDVSRIDGAARAVSRYKDKVKERRPAPAGSFALGRPGMERRIRDELGLDYTIGQIEALAELEAERVGALLARECARFGRKRSPDEITAAARKAWRPPFPMLGAYKKETDRVSRAFREARVVTFPHRHELRLKPLPEFLRPIIATAAYNPPGAFDKKQIGIFWVKEPRAGSESELLGEARQHFGMPLTCAHEALPGHHLQFVLANQHPRKWRRLFAHAVFYEGWTLWCEQMTVDLKIASEPALRVQQLHDALWRCHRILIDLRLQIGRYSHKQAAAHLQKRLGFTKGRAEAEANWYSTQPAVPMSYWLGRLEMARLHRRLVQGAGWSLRKFNDWLLSHGTVPQAWIEKYGMPVR